MAASESSPELKVSVSFGNLQAQFAGHPQAVLTSLNNFLARELPALDLAMRISLSYDTGQLVDMFADYVKLTPEGPRVWMDQSRLSDKLLIGLQLVAVKLGNLTGRMDTDLVGLSDLQASTGLKGKSLSSRLSELVKSGLAARDSEGEGVKYRITTQGVFWLSQALSKKGTGK